MLKLTPATLLVAPPVVATPPVVALPPVPEFPASEIDPPAALKPPALELPPLLLCVVPPVDDVAPAQVPARLHKLYADDPLQPGAKPSTILSINTDGAPRNTLDMDSTPQYLPRLYCDAAFAYFNRREARIQQKSSACCSCHGIPKPVIRDCPFGLPLRFRRAWRAFQSSKSLWTKHEADAQIHRSRPYHRRLGRGFPERIGVEPSVLMPACRHQIPGN